MKDRALFLDIAHRIGTRIVAHAGWDGAACTWQIMTVDYARPESKEPVPAVADGSIYQGTAGIALFLAALYPHTQDPDVQRTAEGAVQYALDRAASLPVTDFAFHSGRVGIAYAAARVGTVLERPDWLDAAYELVVPMAGHESQDYGIDVISGAAGAIPALLQLDAMLGQDSMKAIACGLGDHLIDIAQREPAGWAWNTMPKSSVRSLLGLAHGAAGMAHALLELYHATGNGAYRYAAEQAFLYEHQFFDAQESNWPDFRHIPISDYLVAGRMDDLRDDLKAGRVPPYTLQFGEAWCHGAPGIGLTRLRAYELLGHPRYRAEAEAAIQATEASLDVPGSSFSLCHGLAGNSETLLYGADILGDARLRDRAEACARWGWHTFEEPGIPWICGTMNGVPDPSLMLGEAGIGHFYLRLYAPETPSVLFLRTPEPTADAPEQRHDYRTLRRNYVDRYFARTLRVVEALLPDAPPVIDEETPFAEPDVAAAYRALETLIAQQKPPLRTMLEDAFRPDRLRYQMALALTNYLDEFFDDLLQDPVEDIAWDDVMLERAPHAQIVESNWDWDAWLQRHAEGEEAAPEPARVFYLLHRANNRIHLSRRGPLTVLILDSLAAPATLDQVIEAVQEALDGGHAMDRAVLREKVVEQLKQVYQAGLVRRPVGLHEMADAG